MNQFQYVYTSVKEKPKIYFYARVNNPCKVIFFILTALENPGSRDNDSTLKFGW